MESVKILVSAVIDIIKAVYGHTSFGNTLLLSPLIFWVICQIISYFKLILRSSYKKW